MPVAASAIAPTRPPGRAYSHARCGHQRGGQQGTRADADFRTQDACLGGQHQQQHDTDQGDRDACDGEHLADPALGAFLLRLGRGRRRHGRSRMARAAEQALRTAAGTAVGTAASTAPQAGRMAAACGTGGATGACGCSDSSRSSAVRSVETLAMYCEIAAKSAESRAITARCGSVMPTWSQLTRRLRMSRTTRLGRVRSHIAPAQRGWRPEACGTSPARGSPRCGGSTTAVLAICLAVNPLAT